MQYPAKTLPAPASTGYAAPVPMPQPVHVPASHYPCPKPAYVQPVAYKPACAYPFAGNSWTGSILVLFILLVIVSRGLPYYGEAKICRK
jgi:hypothetical protein